MASVRWGGLRLEPYNPDAVDADNDGIVQEGTAWERPAGTRLLDELGNEIERGLQSMQRPNLQVVDSNGNKVDYKPTYQRGTAGSGIRPQQKLSTLGELGYPSLKEMGIRSIGDMVPTIGEIVRPKQKVIDVEGSIFNMKRKISADRIIPKRGNRERGFKRADEKAKELAFLQGNHYLVESDSDFLILSPSEFDAFFEEVNGPDGMPSGIAVSKYEKPRPKQGDDAAIKADLLGPREMEIDDVAYRDALVDIHHNFGNPTLLNDDLFIPVVFDENLEMNGYELLNPDGSQATFEDILTGRKKLSYDDVFENRRFTFRQKKSDFQQNDTQGGLWSVFQVTDKETGEVWYIKGSTYPADDAILELLGMRAGSLLDLAAQADARNVRISPPATVRIVGDRSLRWTAMRSVDEWNHPDGQVLAWTDGITAGGINPDKVSIDDIAQILTMDFILGNSDRHEGNLMVAMDANGVQRLAIIDNGILAGGRLHSERDEFGYDFSVKDITDRLEAEAAKQPDEIFSQISGNFLYHSPNFKTMNARLGDIDGDGGEFIEATKRTVEKIKANLEELFDTREYSRRGVPLTPTERAHIEGIKKVALKRIELLENDSDLIWYQAWSPIPGLVQGAKTETSQDGKDVDLPEADVRSAPEATSTKESLALPLLRLDKKRAQVDKPLGEIPTKPGQLPVPPTVDSKKITDEKSAVEAFNDGAELADIPSEFMHSAIIANANLPDGDPRKRFKKTPKNGGKMKNVEIYSHIDESGETTGSGFVFTSVPTPEFVGGDAPLSQVVAQQLLVGLGFEASPAILDGAVVDSRGVRTDSLYAVLPHAWTNAPAGKQVSPDVPDDERFKGNMDIQAMQLLLRDKGVKERLANLAASFGLDLRDRNSGNSMGGVFEDSDGTLRPYVIPIDLSIETPRGRITKVDDYMRDFWMDLSLVDDIKTVLSPTPDPDSRLDPLTDEEKEKIKRDLVDVWSQMTERFEQMASNAEEVIEAVRLNGRVEQYALMYGWDEETTAIRMGEVDELSEVTYAVIKQAAKKLADNKKAFFNLVFGSSDSI